MMNSKEKYGGAFSFPDFQLSMPSNEQIMSYLLHGGFALEFQPALLLNFRLADRRGK